VWWDRPAWRLPAEEAEDYRRRLEAIGYRCVVFPLSDGAALLHVGGRDAGDRFRFRSRFAAEVLLGVTAAARGRRTPNRRRPD
jgi:hypothetical protein